jgi:hypothetical protein
MNTFVVGYEAPKHIDGLPVKLVDGLDGIIACGPFDQV